MSLDAKLTYMGIAMYKWGMVCARERDLTKACLIVLRLHPEEREYSPEECNPFPKLCTFYHYLYPHVNTITLKSAWCTAVRGSPCGGCSRARSFARSCSVPFVPSRSSWLGLSRHILLRRRSGVICSSARHYPSVDVVNFREVP